MSLRVFFDSTNLSKTTLAILTVIIFLAVLSILFLIAEHIKKIMVRKRIKKIRKRKSSSIDKKHTHTKKTKVV